MVMRYTGLSIGDTAKLKKEDVQGCRIRTYRKKTGEDVFARVPQFVARARRRSPFKTENILVGKSVFQNSAKSFSFMVSRAGLEPATLCLKGTCSTT
jgi:hypothetical protein